jgi:hypothetical protein
VNKKDVGFDIELAKIKLKILGVLEDANFTGGVVTMAVPRHKLAIASRACEDLKEELTKRKVGIQIQVEEELEIEEEEERTPLADLAFPTLVTSFAFACEELAKLKGVPAYDVKSAFTKQAHDFVINSSVEEFDKFMEQNYTPQTEAG